MTSPPIPDYLNITNLRSKFPSDFTEDQIAASQTKFLKKLAVAAHTFYGGKMMSVPKAGVYGFGWFGVWYTPGVSGVSVAIREDNLKSYDMSNRGNLIAVVSDSTRVLGDGDCTPPGGLGVMEGKAFLMQYLGGVDATALCINSYNEKGEHDPDKIIDFVKMATPSFGGVNLEDISQPNCFKVLDNLQECGIPVWHDDAQGTACVTLAGLINALKLTNRKMGDAKMVLYGAGASNSTIARFLIADGADPKKLYLFDSRGGLHRNRKDIEEDKERFYRKWELCQSTNPECIDDVAEAMKGADVLIALSKPGPDVVKQEWIRNMADKSIVFVCANPVPEIYPHKAKEAGAYIVATGRSDFPNQVNNSLGFPGILKGALLVRAKCITDRMAIAAAHSIALTAEQKGLSLDYIIPTMEEADVFPQEACAVALAAMEEGVAQKPMEEKEILETARKDIKHNRDLVHHLMETGYIKPPPRELVETCLNDTIAEMRK